MTLLVCLALASAADMAEVGPGTYRPLFAPSPEENEIPVPAFQMDVRPVTNAEFLAFVKARPEWRRDRIPGVMADAAYLQQWSGAAALGPSAPPDRPVTGVSWFAARAFCEAEGKVLPTEAQWELAAAASETEPDASGDPEIRSRILAWYSEPASRPLGPVGQSPPNYWGVQDLHGLVWEWVEDFSSALVSVDSRENGGADKNAFCGAATLSAKDMEDYAAFLRIGFRSSLQGSYTTSRLGFRCAQEMK